MVELYRNHINGKSGGYHFQPFTHNPRTIYTRHKGLYDGIPAHLAGLLSPMHLTLRHRPPVSHTGHSDSSAPLIILISRPRKPALFIWVSLLQILQTSAWKVSWKPFLNTASRWISNFYIVYTVCLYCLQSNDQNTLCICMVRYPTLEARTTASLQVLRLAQWLQHRRHSIYICEWINPSILFIISWWRVLLPQAVS